MRLEPRLTIALGIALAAAASSAQTPAPGKVLLDQLRAGGLVLFMRHAHADVGEDLLQDPTFWQECKKQRNLSNTGKLDANRVGLALRGLGVPVSRVFTSGLCRALDTGKLLQVGQPEVSVGLSDYNTWKAMGNDPDKLPDVYRTTIAMQPAAGTNHVLVSHAHRGRFTAHPVLDLIEMGTVAVFRPFGTGAFELLGTIRPGDWQYLGVQELPSK